MLKGYNMDIIKFFEDCSDNEKDEFMEWFEYCGSTPDMLEGCKIEAVYDFGGEGQGSHAEMVRKITTRNGAEQLVRVTGYYASYEGLYWHFSYMHICKPVKKVVIVYEKISLD